MFADDTNPFYSHNNVKELFRTMNVELSHLNDWFGANKLSLNTDKTKYVLFHKAKSKNNLPLVLPDLFINDVKIKSENSLRFLRVVIDENLTWKTHVEFRDRPSHGQLNVVSENQTAFYVKYYFPRSKSKICYKLFSPTILKNKEILILDGNHTLTLYRLFNEWSHPSNFELIWENAFFYGQIQNISQRIKN